MRNRIFESFEGQSEIALLIVANMAESSDLNEIIGAQYLFNQYFYDMK
jgi:hypothetical protein